MQTPAYSIYVGKGNNSSLIKSAFKLRLNWYIYIWSDGGGRNMRLPIVPPWTWLGLNWGRTTFWTFYKATKITMIIQPCSQPCWTIHFWMVLSLFKNDQSEETLNPMGRVATQILIKWGPNLCDWRWPRVRSSRFKIDHFSKSRI